jgi:hypothetical protein
MTDRSKQDSERRRGERFPVNAEFAELEPGTLIFVSNVSESGVFVNTSECMPIGTHVEIEFTVLLDDPVVISGPGVVVYHLEQPRGMGVEFGTLSPAMALRLADVVSHQRTRAARSDSSAAVRTRSLSDEELAQLAELEDESEPEYIDF